MLGVGEGQFQTVLTLHGDPAGVIEITVGQDHVSDLFALQTKPRQIFLDSPVSGHRENPALLCGKFIAQAGIDHHLGPVGLDQQEIVGKQEVIVLPRRELFAPQHLGHHPEHAAGIEQELAALEPVKRELAYLQTILCHM